MGMVDQGGHPCQKMDFQTLPSGASNLPGVFAIILGPLRGWSEGVGRGSVFDPSFGREIPKSFSLFLPADGL